MADAASELDPEAMAVIDDFLATGLPPWHALSVDSARQLEDELFSSDQGAPVGTVRDVRIDGPGGPLRIRLYRPSVADPATLVFLHGGGWTLGTLDSADDICRELAVRGDSIVVSVDYRLAPEDPFPSAIYDGLAAVEWAASYAATVGGDPDRLTVAGTSAGGNLAAAVALLDGRGSGVVDATLLLYPITDHDFETVSYREHADSPLLSRADMEWFWSNYLRAPIDGDNPFASVLRHPTLDGLPPTIVLTAGYDVLRDEGAAFADRVAEAGVDTRHLHYPALPHGLLSLTDRASAADEAMDELARAYREMLDRTG